jgi:hypothetical protein
MGLGTSFFALLFTTKRVIMIKTHGMASYLALAITTFQMGSRTQSIASEEIEREISADNNNFAIPYSEIIAMRVKKPKAFGWGKVSIVTALGETTIKISNKGLVGAHKENWEFLHDPPADLRDKLVVE